MKCVSTILFLLVTSESAFSASSEDPSGWNSFFETSSQDYNDAVDVVDPSGWNYVRGTKSSARNLQEDKKEQKLTFCRSILEKENFQIKPITDENEVQIDNVIQISETEKQITEKGNFQVNPITYKREVQIENVIQIAETEKQIKENENFQIIPITYESEVQIENVIEIADTEKQITENENFQINPITDESEVQIENVIQFPKTGKQIKEKENLKINPITDEIEVEIENEIQIAVKRKVENLFSQTPVTSTVNVAFAKRFVNILLEAADLFDKEFNNENYVSGLIEIRVSQEHFKTLVKFGNSDLNVSMKELDSILTASIRYAHVPVFGIPELVDKIFFMASQKEICLPVFLFFICLGAFYLLKSCKTTTRFVITIVLLIFSVGYVVEYYRMYQEAAIRQRIVLEKYKDLPSSCNLDGSWWTALKRSFSFSSIDIECEKYYKASLQDPLVDVSPVRVLSSILSDFIFYAISKFGTAFAEFTSAVVGELPFHVGLIAWAGSSFAIFLIVVFAIVILLGGSIGFRGWFGDVNITKNSASQVTAPSTQPAVEVSHAPVLPRSSVSEPVLQAVTGMRNFVLMDSNSFGDLMLRAQSNVSLSPSGVQELTEPITNSISSQPCKEKKDLCSAKPKELLSRNENTHPGNIEISNAQDETFRGNIDQQVKGNSGAKSVESPVQEELLGSFEVIKTTETISSSDTQF